MLRIGASDFGPGGGIDRCWSTEAPEGATSNKSAELTNKQALRSGATKCA